MHRRLFPLSFAFVFAACLLAPNSGAAEAGAAVPPLVKFSGMLAQHQGTVGVIFALYAEQTGGAPLWLETQNVTPDERGRYTIYLGANHANGLPLNLFASGEARWLGVQPEGQPEQARVQLLSVPYALTAGDAQTLGGQPLSAFVLASAANGSATTGSATARSASAVLASGSGGAMPNTYDIVLTTAGNTNYMAKFFNTMGDIEDSLIYDNGTNVGVGTTTPLAMLHVVGSPAPSMFVDVYSGDSGTALGSLPMVYRAARGTAGSPSAVQTDDILGGLAVRGWGTTGFTSGRGQVMFRASQPWTDTANGTYLEFTTTPNNGNIWLERMRIDNAGNVGIGTTTPSAMLEVNGTAQFDGLVTFASGQTFPGIMTTGSPGAVVAQGTPARSSAACAPPQVMYDSSYIYTCVAANTWRRAASAAF